MKLKLITKKITGLLVAAAMITGLYGVAFVSSLINPDKAYAVTLSSGTKADIVFVIDSTGSMEPYIKSVKENLTNFVESLKTKSLELNMAVVEYRDIFEDGDSSTVYYDFDGSHWTSSVDKVVDVLIPLE